MPEVGGGPSTSILTAGSDASMSLQLRLGFGTIAPSEGPPSWGISFASARKSCCRVIEKGSAALELASTTPSKPILTSVMSVTPFSAHLSTSEDLIRREALVMSG